MNTYDDSIQVGRDSSDDEFESEDLEDLLETFVKNIVSDPSLVEIETIEIPSGSETITIDCKEGDRGKVIGKDGCIIKSLNTIFHALGCKRGRDIKIDMANE